MLQVTANALDLAVPDDARCVSSGCLHSAIRGNCGHCPAHRRGWYPLPTVGGGDLFGPAFLRIAGKFRTCDCSQPAGKSAGYFPGQDVLYIPAVGLHTALKTLNLLSLETKQQLKDKTREIIYLYASHFFPGAPNAGGEQQCMEVGLYQK